MREQTGSITLLESGMADPAELFAKARRDPLGSSVFTSLVPAREPHADITTRLSPCKS